MSEMIKSGLRRIWLSPRQATAGLAGRGEGHGVAVAVAAALGISLPFPTFVEIAEEGSVSFDWSSAPGVVVLGCAVAIGGLFLLSWLFRNFSRMFGGVATIREVRIALGWSLLPLCALSVFGALLTVFLLPALANVEEPAAAMAPLGLFMFMWLIYAYAICVLGLAGVTGISLMKTFLAVCLTVAVSIFPVVALLQWLSGGV